MKENLAKNGQKNCFFYNIDFLKKGFKANSFDSAISLHTLYHIALDKQKFFVKKLLKYVRLGGLVIIVYSNPFSLESILTAPTLLYYQFKLLIKNICIKLKLYQDKKNQLYFKRKNIFWWNYFKKFGKLKIMKSNKKIFLFSILTLIISLTISFIILEIGVRYFYKTKRDMPSYEMLVSYNKLGVLNHHIRDYNKNLFEKGHQYYSIYKKKIDKSDKIEKILIFQGDSWGEILDRTNLSKKILSKYETFINGGTSSYSPSLMEVQLKDIINDLDLKKNILDDLSKSITIMTYIDQTDFMDEACDYNKFRVIDKNGELVSVRKPSGLIAERAMHDHSYELFNIFKIKTFYLISNRWHQFLWNQRNQNSPIRCNWKDIEKFMIGKENFKDYNKFKSSLVSYLNTSLNYSKNVILLTHRHRKHFEGSYSNDINTILKRILYEEKINKYVKVVDLSENLFNANPNTATLDEVFPGHQEDPGSHPHFEYYQNILTEKIYNLAD